MKKLVQHTAKYSQCVMRKACEETWLPCQSKAYKAQKENLKQVSSNQARDPVTAKSSGFINQKCRKKLIFTSWRPLFLQRYSFTENMGKQKSKSQGYKTTFIKQNKGQQKVAYSTKQTFHNLTFENED